MWGSIRGLAARLGISCPGRAVSAAEFGASWPWTVEAGVLTCEPPGSSVVLTTPDGQEYAINGRARGMARWRDGNEIRRADPETGAIGDVGEMIALGLSLCEDAR